MKSDGNCPHCNAPVPAHGEIEHSRFCPLSEEAATRRDRAGRIARQTSRALVERHLRAAGLAEERAVGGGA